jgi:hypothetical protein
MRKMNNNIGRKAIRQKCLDCTCWQEAEIRRCTAQDCALYPFRMGNVAKAREIENSKATGVIVKSLQPDNLEEHK